MNSLCGPEPRDAMQREIFLQMHSFKNWLTRGLLHLDGHDGLHGPGKGSIQYYGITRHNLLRFNRIITHGFSLLLPPEKPDLEPSPDMRDVRWHIPRYINGMLPGFVANDAKEYHRLLCRPTQDLAYRYAPLLLAAQLKQAIVRGMRRTRMRNADEMHSLKGRCASLAVSRVYQSSFCVAHATTETSSAVRRYRGGADEDKCPGMKQSRRCDPRT